MKEPKTDTLHVSLNFCNSDMLSKEKIMEIAFEYMDKSVSGRQPYLVYQPFYSDHMHFILLTTDMQENGTRIV